MAKRSIKRTRRLIALLACIALAMGLLPATASAEGGPDAGMPLAASALGATRGTGEPCGDNLTWVLDDSGTLTISGTGAMKDWNNTADVPWHIDSARITNVVINDGVTSIGDSAFFFCTALESVEIPGSVKTIGTHAFDTCYNLESVEIPGGVTSIGSGAFHACRSLESIEIPGGVKSIGDDAFNDCFGLTRVTIPNGVTSIGDFAFFGCTALESVEIPKSVESIGDEAFYGCDKLADVYFFGTEQQWRAAVGDNGVVPSSTTVHFVDGKCGDSAYWALDDSGTLTISGKGEMYDYTYSQGVPWYSNKDKITEVVIGDDVTSIGGYAFYFCKSLKSVKGMKNVESVGNDAFFSCTSLTSIEGMDAVTSIGERAFSSCELLASVKIPDSVTSIGGQAFFSCKRLTSITIPKGIRSIEKCTFQNCEGLVSVKIPGNVTSIGERAFVLCEGLTSVEIAAGVTTIGERAFSTCAELTSVSIPDSVESIEKYTFLNCGKLSRVCFGGSKAQWNRVTKDEDWDKGTPENKAIVYSKWDVAASADPTVGGLVTGAGVYTKDPADMVTLEAVPNDGYCFMGWTKKGDEAIISSDAKYKFKATENAEYVAHFKIPLTITAKDAKLPYNGQKQGPGDIVYEDGLSVVVSGLKGDDKLTAITVDGQGDAAGTYDLVPSAAAIGENGKLTDNYEITYVTGTLTIEPAKATVTTGSASKIYDSKALTNAEASISGLVEGETAAVTATGSQTGVGSSPNTYTIEWGSAKKENYTVTENLGTLTVEAAPARKGTLTFDLAGGTLDGRTGTITIEANVGDTIKLPGAPAKDGYTFRCWKGSQYAAGAEYKVEGDHAFTAEWAAVHKVTFDANGHGKAPDAQEVEHGKKAKRPVSPTADGYTFGGWYTDKACKEAYDFSAPVTSDITLYAKWTKKSSSSTSGTSPKTGDPLGGAFALALALAAVSGLVVAASRRRRRG